MQQFGIFIGTSYLLVFALSGNIIRLQANQRQINHNWGNVAIPVLFILSLTHKQTHLLSRSTKLLSNKPKEKSCHEIVKARLQCRCLMVQVNLISLRLFIQLALIDLELVWTLGEGDREWQKDAYPRRPL